MGLLIRWIRHQPTSRREDGQLHVHPDPVDKFAKSIVEMRVVTWVNATVYDTRLIQQPHTQHIEPDRSALVTNCRDAFAVQLALEQAKIGSLDSREPFATCTEVLAIDAQSWKLNSRPIETVEEPRPGVHSPFTSVNV